VAKKSSGQGELIHHITGVRMRVQGSGNLDMSLLGLDDLTSTTLAPFVMAATRAIEPTRLANFKGQRILLRFGVDEIDEWFQIRRIIIFVKPVETSYPSILDT
jgi:hypothetical protein